MHWNYRLVNLKSRNGGEPWIELCEVYYNDDESLMTCTDVCLGSETLDGMKKIIERLNIAMTHPVIEEEDFKGEAE